MLESLKETMLFKEEHGLLLTTKMITESLTTEELDLHGNFLFT